MKEKIFKVTNNDTGHIYNIYSDGSISGFPDNCSIVNYHSCIVDSMHAERNDKETLHALHDVALFTFGESTIEVYFASVNKVPFHPFARTNNKRYFYDNMVINGYFAIRDHSDEDKIIWIDCKKEQLEIIIEALNET